MDECPICLEEMNDDIVTMYCCKQKIHHRCAVQWMSHGLSCPMCRYRFDSVVTTPELVIQDRKPYFFKNIFIGSVVLATSGFMYNYFLF